MAMYDIKEKLYPILPSAPEDVSSDQVYRLHHIRDIEQFLNSEIVERQRLYKKFHRGELVACYIEHGLIASGVIFGSGGIAALCTGVGTPLSIILGAIAIAASLGSSVTKKTLKVYNIKTKKHSDICNAAQTILNGITSQISQAIQDGDISPKEFDKILTEKQRYLEMKKSVRSKTKKLVKEINESQKKELLEQGRREGREEIAKKLVKPFDIQDVSAI